MTLTQAADWRPSVTDLALERMISAARLRLQYGTTPFVRRRALRDIEKLIEARSPAMAAYLLAHPERERG